MADNINLAITFGATGGTDNFYISSILYDIKADVLRITLEGKSGESWNGYGKSVEYTGATARSLISDMNTMDCSTDSMCKHLLTQLKTDGYIDGTIV